MPSRRGFLAGLLASGLTPRLSWADAGHPTHLSAAMDPNGAYALYGLRADGARAFRIPLPGRGHAAAAHPTYPEAVAFARRPGRFALVLDCVSGAVRHRLDAPAGRHFYGHGAYAQDGTRLYTTENQIDTGQGRIGIWARDEGFERIGEIASGGIGPHEVLRLPGTDTLAVANGGIHTHPDTGREKLNLDTMRPNLTLMASDGSILDHVALNPALHQNSLRHIAARADGTVACAFQWQGDPFDAPPLLALYRPGQGLRLATPDEITRRAMNAYAGSVGFLATGEVAITSPRGGTLQVFDAQGQFITQYRQPDICGVAETPSGGLASDGTGRIYRLGRRSLTELASHRLAFDNHLIAI